MPSNPAAFQFFSRWIALLISFSVGGSEEILIRRDIVIRNCGSTSWIAVSACRRRSAV